LVIRTERYHRAVWNWTVSFTSTLWLASTEEEAISAANKPLRSLFVEGEGRGTPPPNSQGPDQCIFEGSASIPQSDGGMVNLLLVLNLERIGRQHHLDVGYDFLPRTLVMALKDPDHFEDGDQADKAWFLFGELACDDFRRTCRLDWIILYQVAQQDIGIETDHFFCLNLCVAPASTAASISSRETGLAGFGMIPFSRDVGIFGRMITPSGWKKNLNRSPV
jgi:hypothetical protein